MKDFIYSEKFDNYLKGKLQKDEKISFEEELRQDPLLRNEVKWQQEIYYSLGDARRVYLKNRLNQIPLNSGAWYNFTGIQWAAVVSSLFIFAGGSYFYFVQSQSSIKAQQITSVDITVPEKNQQIPNKELKLVFPVPNFDESAPEDKSLTASSELSSHNADLSIPENSKIRSALKLKNGEEVLPKIVRPDVLSSFSEESLGIDYSDFEVPDKTLLEKSESSVAEVEIETVLDSKYNFHYQLFNHKLYLHGDFQGIPYKVIALNKDEAKKLFLEFNGDFYKLRQEQTEITLLEVIEDSTVINALMKLSR
ncbi:hypothetical protein [Catalinimonas niigatensis]|uniref:hypothetical protein n=1 Tax=Catalinimonas niigatensis TaxID=1397264 RepID=UPI002666298C|nr:hypothetical protein [Catalinimonas niigatensis]WPP52308.1 hypothetical protein PZB72_07935 [Catalinimonas niigatensis]